MKLIKQWRIWLLVLLSLLLLLGCSGLDIEENGQEVGQENTMSSNKGDATYMQNRHLIITIGNKQLKAKIEDNATVRAFIEQLPMTITMHDLHNREKYTKISGLVVEGINIPNFSKGDISYWTPGEAFVIYYKGDEEPLNGLVKMGEISENLEILENYPGDIEVTIDIE